MHRIIIADVKSVNEKHVNPGHYFSLVRNYLDLFAGIAEVIPAGGPIYSENFNEVLLLPYDYRNDVSELFNKFNVLRNCRTLRNYICDDDVVIMQQSGAVTMFIGLVLSSFRKKSVYTIFYDTDPLHGIIKRLIFSLAKNKIKGVLCPSSQIGEAYSLPYCVVSDYICTKKIDIHSLLSYENRKYDFAIVGRIVPEKGVVEVMRYFAGTKYKLIVAGKPDSQNMEDDLKQISSTCDNIELRLSYISEKDYDDILLNSKYSIMNYQGVYFNRSSGVVLDSIFRGTPVVAHRCMAMNIIEDENLGLLYDDINRINLIEIFNCNTYSKYLKSIARYVEVNMELQNKLVSFLQGD